MSAKRKRPDRSHQIVRCVTLNLKGSADHWFDIRFNALVKGLRSRRPHLLFLQEVALQCETQTYLQAGEIGKALNLPFVSFTPYGNPLEVLSAEQGGIALVSAWPILSIRNRPLPSARVYPPDARVALIATVASPAGEIHVINTHLSWRPEESPVRLVQTGLLLQELGRENALAPDSKTIFAGDLNAQEDEPAIQLLDEHLVDTFRWRHPDDPGFTDVRSNPLSRLANLPDRRLDYIFCSPGARIIRSEVILSGARKVYVSDHFGVLADVSWKKAA